MDEQKARGNTRMKRIIRGTPAAGPARWVSIRFGGGITAQQVPGRPTVLILRIFCDVQHRHCFGPCKDTNKPREKSKFTCIFSEAEYLRRSQNTNKRGQKQVYLHFAGREYLRRSQNTNKPREKSKFACIFSERKYRRLCAGKGTDGNAPRRCGKRSRHPKSAVTAPNPFRSSGSAAG